jgi:methionine-rich copper-binding protein CopC
VPKGRAWGWLLLAFALAAATAFAQKQPPAPVAAHALLERADPPVNSQVREPPSVLTLFFSEPLERRFSSVRVVEQDGFRFEVSV